MSFDPSDLTTAVIEASIDAEASQPANRSGMSI